MVGLPYYNIYQNLSKIVLIIKFHIDGRQPKTRISKFAIVQKTKKTDLFCNATLHCA